MVVAVATKESVLVDEWVGCYRGGWKGVIIDEAFSHPAKVAFNLAKRIYEHAIEGGWIHPDDVVIDPFGGIGGCAFHGVMNGMIVVTNELEEKFVNLSKQNRELWREKFTGLPGFNADNWIILQGDSRRLAAVISEAGFAVSSPPYSTLGQNQGTDNRRHEIFSNEKQANSANVWREGYGESAGQLGAMREGDLSLAISSPPYAVVSPEKSSRSVDYEKQYATYRTQGGGASFGKFVATQKLHSQGYGSSDGQLSQLSGEGFQAAISSPPYEGSQVGTGERGRKGWRGYTDIGGGTYAQEAQLSAQPADTFWSASRVILKQLYSVLTPGAHAIFIVKAFVRDKKIVDFPAQWAQLCEAVGFKLIHDHHALLTEHSGTQGGFFGEDKEHKVKRVSFFRRLHEKKSPETAIDYENVLCFERP